MSISALRPRPGPAGVLAEVVAAVRDLDATWWTSVSDDDLVAAVELVERARSALAAVQAGAVAEADHRGLAKQNLAYRSTGDWLTHLGGLRKGEGRRMVARAHALAGPLAATREAMAAGRVSPEQADVIVRSIDALPIGDAVRRRGESTLLECAGRFDATDLARTGRHLVHVVDPDGMERRWERQLDREERAAHHSRYLTITNDGAGGVRIKGRGSAEDGALIKAALQPLTTPTPAFDDGHHGQDGQDRQLVHDPRDAGARMWDALTTVAQHALDTDLPPQTHGAPARLTVTTTTLQSLQTGVADSRLGEGLDQDLSVATLRRLACDAEVIPAVLGTKSEPLDVGRTRRLVTLAIWTALLLRDNLVLLCGHHHRTLHHTPWTVRLNPEDRKPEFKPPPKPGMENTWFRHRPRRE